LRTLRSVLVLFLALALVASLAACQSGPKAAGALTDDAGRTVELTKVPQRIVSLAPSNTEILFALGLGDKVVGVTDFCDYPPEAAAIAKVGGIEPNVETIVALKPDLILAIGGSPVTASIAGNVELLNKFDELKLNVLILSPTDLESVLADIKRVGPATGAEKAAEQLVAEKQKKVEDVVARTKNAAQRPKVFYELDATDPAKPFTPGPGSWHDTFIAMAGGVNIAANAKSQWAQLSTEEIVAQNPDLIILGDANWGMDAPPSRRVPVGAQSRRCRRAPSTRLTTTS